MEKTGAMVALAMLIVAVVSVGVSAEEPPAGLSAPEWRQITSAIQVEEERRAAEARAKDTVSLYALDQKLGPEPTIPHARFGNSVAIDGDVAVVGAAWANLAFVFARGTGGWELQQTLEGIWEDGPGCEYQSWFFGKSVAIDGPIIVVGAPNFGCYDPDGPDEIWGNVFIYEETAPGSWNFTVSVLDLVSSRPLLVNSYLGRSVAMSGTTVAAGAVGFLSNSGACVVSTKSSGNWAFEYYLLPPFPADDDRFGDSVAVFGDTAVVGAPNDIVSFSPEAGRVHVFNRSGSSWSHTVDLTASDSGAGNHFGTSVSLVPPVLLVGAPDDDHAAGIDAGSAYVFTQSGGIWSERQKLIALDGEADDRFGSAIALGWGLAVVGASDDNHGIFAIDAGSAYVFTSIAGTWFQSEKLLAPDGGTSDLFGSSVAVWGTTTLVGSPLDDVGGVMNVGSAHFFEQDGSVWVHDTSVLGTREGIGKTFGYSVAVDGEIMVVGVADESGNFPAQGEIYIFKHDGDSWELEFVAHWGDNLRYFGGAVAVSGDTVLVGIYDWGFSQGTVFVYRREVGLFGPVWEVEQSLLANDGAPGDTFGFDVAIDGDTAVIGAPYKGVSNGTPVGAAYVFSRSGAVWTQEAILESSDPAEDDRFGFGVDVEGDVLVAGACEDDGGAANAGAAFVFRRDGGTWIEEQKLVADVPQPQARLGMGVALDGGTLIAGAPGTEVSGHPAAGAAHIFVESAGVWNEEQRLTAAVPNTGNFFGWDVAISGETAVIGNPRSELDPHGQVGSVEVFYRVDSTWARHQQLVADAPEYDARFGREIAVTAGGILIAAPEEGFTTAHPGAIYWFEGSILETDLAIGLDDGVTEVVPGTGVNYLAVVTNAGPNEAMGATVSDTFPPELLGCTWTCVAFGGSVCTPGPVSGDIADTVDLPVSGRLEYTIDCLVDPAATGDLMNTASVAAPPGVADTNPLNNSAADLDTLTPVADLSIGKDNGVTRIIEGQTTTYTITVANAGPSDAPASAVTDAFPPELTDCTWTCSPGTGAVCAAAGVGDINDLVDLPAGSGVAYLATCTVAASGGLCSNTADVAEPIGVTDPDPLDNDATDSDEVVGFVDVVYVSRILEGEVAVIDVQTDTVIRLLDTGSNPAEVGIVTGLSSAFVADLTDGTVTVVDTGDHGIDDVIDLGVPVATVGVDESAQRVYALDFSNGVPGTDLHVIDAGTHLVIDTFTVGSRTQNIAVSAADDLAYITDFDDGIVEIDTVTGAIVRTLPMADLPHGIALDDTADRLYVTRLDSDSVAVIDQIALTVNDSLAVGDVPQWIALDPPRNKAFVTNEGAGTVSVIDTLTNTVHPAAIPVGAGPLTLTIHEGAAKAYVYNADDGTISVIDTVSEAVIAILAPLFADGFESGDTGAWAVTSP